jgi:hypothetical protein
MAGCTGDGNTSHNLPKRKFIDPDKLLPRDTGEKITGLPRGLSNDPNFDWASYNQDNVADRAQQACVPD